MKSDIDIKRDVEEELRMNPDLDATDIAVAVKDGVVTLSGFVRSYSQKWEAERTAERVQGVRGIANNEHRSTLAYFQSAAGPRDRPRRRRRHPGRTPLFIRPYPRYRARRLGDAGRPSRVELLEGACRTGRSTGSASKKSPTSSRSARVSRRLRSNGRWKPFRRNAELDANRITVETDGGTVILRGTVRSWAEREEA